MTPLIHVASESRRRHHPERVKSSSAVDSRSGDRLCSRALKAGFRITLIVTVALAVAALVAAGCGSSSKPAYCSDVTNLQNSVNSLKSVQLQSGAVSTLKTDVQKVQTNANAVVSSAKQDFPSQTSALQSSVSSLSTSVQALPASPTAQQLVPIAAEVASTVSAADSLKSATSSACD